MEDVRSTLPPLERRLRSAPIPPTDSPEDPEFSELTDDEISTLEAIYAEEAAKTKR